MMSTETEERLAWHYNFDADEQTTYSIDTSTLAHARHVAPEPVPAPEEIPAPWDADIAPW